MKGDPSPSPSSDESLKFEHSVLKLYGADHYVEAEAFICNTTLKRLVRYSRENC